MLIVFVVTGFERDNPKSAAVVYAEGREHAKYLLATRLLNNTDLINFIDPDRWTITPITPVPEFPSAHIILR